MCAAGGPGRQRAAHSRQVVFRQRAPTQATEPKLWICFETLWRALCASGLAKKIETTNASPAAKLFQTPNAHQLVCFKFWSQAVGSKAASASIVPAPKACFKLSSQTAPRRQLSACSQGLFQTLFETGKPSKVSKSISKTKDLVAHLLELT